MAHTHSVHYARAAEIASFIINILSDLDDGGAKKAQAFAQILWLVEGAMLSTQEEIYEFVSIPSEN